MSNWSDARKGFFELLDQIDEVRANLHCSLSSAWFRGETNFGWNLHPSLFRISDDIGEDDSDFDRKKLINGITSRILKQQEKINKYEREYATLKKKNFENYKQSGEKINLYKENFDEVKHQLGRLYHEKRELEHKIKVIKGLHFGEKDVFVEWTRRAGNINSNSWIVLAEMQHYGVPTRLLDWTENLSVALYFAVEKYYFEIHKYWDNTNLDHQKELPFYVPTHLPSPSLRVLNPYLLADKVTGFRGIVDVTTDKRLDYYNSFLCNFDWEYEEPIPIFPPLTNPRIKAQQGMFTVHGTNRDALDLQIVKHHAILSSIEIKPITAVYIVKHLTNFGIDEFHLYQDFDRLGKKVKKHLYSKR